MSNNQSSTFGNEAANINFNLIVKDYIRTIKLPKIKSKTPVVILLVGIPASGKSYLAKNLVANLPLVLISENDIQSVLVPRVSFFEKGQKVILDFAKQVVKELVSLQYGCIVDANLKTLKLRNEFRETVFAAGGETVVIFLNCLNKLAYERIRKRNQEIIGGEVEGFIIDWDYFQYEINSTEIPTSAEKALTYDSSQTDNQFEKIVINLKSKISK